MAIRFLLDENLSYETANYLHRLGYEACTVAQLHLGQTDDEIIARYALEHDMMIVSMDLDFGYLFHFRFPNKIGMVIVRIENQTVELVNATLKRVIDDPVIHDEKNRYSLITTDGKRIRVYHAPSSALFRTGPSYDSGDKNVPKLQKRIQG